MTLAHISELKVSREPLHSEARRVVYLDNNATTQALPEVRDAVAQALDGEFGNPSSAHSTGERARRNLFKARRSVAELVGADPEDVFFTSGATEANNIVLKSAAHWNKPGGILTTAIEHSSVLKCCEHLEEQGIPITYLAPNTDGFVAPETFEAAIAELHPRLVAIQWVNNETGAIQPTEHIANICKQHDVALLCDGSQAVGKLNINLSESGIDYLTFTGHKFHGPPGVGALVTRHTRQLRPLLHGGDQEGGLRPGTENFPGIVGLGVAASVRNDRLTTIQPSIGAMRDKFEMALLERFSFIRINGDANNRVFNTTNLCFQGLDGQALVARFDANDVRCSQSSACTSSRPEPSYVLRAMGLSEDDAYASIRFAFSELNTPEDVDLAVERISQSVEKLASLFS